MADVTFSKVEVFTGNNFNYTPASVTNPALVVVACNNQDFDDPLDTEFDGSPATRITRATLNNGSSFDTPTDIYVLPDCGTSAINITSTYDDDNIWICMTLANCHQTVPSITGENVNSAASSVSSRSGNITTSVDGSLIIGGFAVGGDNDTPSSYGSGQTEADSSTDSFNSLAVTTEVKSTAGLETTSATWPSTMTSAFLVAAAFQPADAGGGTTPKTVAATAVGSASISTSLEYPHTIAATSTGVVTFADSLTLLGTIAANAVGSATVSKIKEFVRTISGTALGAAAVNTIATFNRTIAATATGVNNFLTGTEVGQTISATAVGVASFVTNVITSTPVSITATAIGNAAVSGVATFLSLINATSTGNATLNTESTFYRTIAATASNTAGVVKLIQKFITAVAVGDASMVKLVTKEIAAVAIGVPLVAGGIALGVTISAIGSGVASITATFIKYVAVVSNNFKAVFRAIFRNPFKDT